MQYPLLVPAELCYLVLEYLIVNTITAKYKNIYIRNAKDNKNDNHILLNHIYGLINVYTQSASIDKICESTSNNFIDYYK